MKHLLLELETHAKGAQQWAAKLYVLVKNTRHPVHDEPEIPYSKFRDVLSQEVADEIEREIQIFKNGQSRSPSETERFPPESQNETRP